MQQRPKYNDIPFFLVAIAFISAFNYHLTYSNIKFNWFLVLTYTIDTVQGWIAWWAVRSIIIWLDKKMPYGERPLKRILIQLLVTTLAGMLIIILLTELVSWIAKGKPAPLSFYIFDVLIITIWFFVINGIYIGLHYYAEWKQSELRRNEEKKVRAGGFPVKHARESLLIPFNDILSFYAEEGYTILLTWQQKKYILDKSLDKIEPSLPSEFFFRLNRQYILHRNAIAGFKRINDGKIDVLVRAQVSFPETIQVSRIKAAAFKNWFQPGSE